MTLTQMKYAIAVADTGSMNEAARSLFIAQPSLSASIRELEQEIGIELFKRTSRGVLATPEGEEFLGYARQVTEQYRLLESRYIEKKNIRRKFSVSMQHYSFAVHAFVEMVRQFGMEEYEFEVHETRTWEVMENVKDGRSEIGILYLNDFNRKVLTKLFKENGLEFHPLFDCGIYVYLWKGHPLANQKEITIDHIIKVVCEYLNLDFERFNSTERTREIAQARQIAMYLSKQHTKAPLTTIGSAIGGRNHATVLHSCKAVSNLIETDKAFRRQVEEIEKKVLAQ